MTDEAQIPTRDGVRCQCDRIHYLDKSKGWGQQAVCPCGSSLWWENGTPWAKRIYQVSPVMIKYVELVYTENGIVSDELIALVKKRKEALAAIE